MASIRFSVRDHSDVACSVWTATARTPSSLRSKIQAGSVKRSSVSVASIGATKPTVVGPHAGPLGVVEAVEERAHETINLYPTGDVWEAARGVRRGP